MGLRALLMKVVLVACALSAEATQSKAGCDSSCGNLSIPYPFGTREGCFRDPTFLITCKSSSGHPILYLRGTNIQVLNISPDTGEVRVSTPVYQYCYDRNKSFIYSSNISSLSENFAISRTKNQFTVVGCNTTAYITDPMANRFDGCETNCSSSSWCQTTFDKGINNYRVTIYSDMYLNQGDEQVRFNPCSYAFLAENGSLTTFSSQELLNLSDKTTYPVVLNWAVGNYNCAHAHETSSYACQDNSECRESEIGTGYICKCKDGFKGNPYLSDPVLGCKEVDRRRSNTWEVSHYLPVLIIVSGVSVTLLVVVTLVSTLCWAQKQRALKQLKQRNFDQNGGNMLLQHFSRQGYTNRAKIFTEVELKNATNNFDQSRILGRGGQGTVYKGILSDNTLVAIKKSRVGGDPQQIRDFITEVFVLSQINHRNVVKLLGCCLETELPLLVYEFVDNGTLLDHIDPLKNEHSITWETRLEIATETAEAIAYLHSAASIPIIHRDIKSANILLDHNNRAKVSDFGASRLVPLDETQVATMVQGTLGYLDPEYLQTGQLNEKSDVYSFGVVLVELLTGKKAIEFNGPEQRNLAIYFVSSMKEDRLWEILDKQVLQQNKKAKQLKEVALLARRCLRVNGEDRPGMKEVAMELEGLIAMEKHPWVKDNDVKVEESEYLLGDVTDEYGAASTSISVITHHSIQKQAAFEIADGR